LARSCSAFGAISLSQDIFLVSTALRSILFFFFLMTRLRPRSMLFPYTTLFRSNRPLLVMRSNLWASGYDVDGTDQTSLGQMPREDRKSGSAGMPRPISYAVFCLKKKQPPPPGQESACCTLVECTHCIRVPLETR